MLTKKVFSFILIFFVCLTTYTPANASGKWVKVITDSRDSHFSADIKSLSVKDDGDEWSFKIESWDNWDLEAARGVIGILINTSGSSNMEDTDYIIVISGSSKTYVGVILELDTEESEFFDCDIEENKSEGTFSVDKTLLDAPKKKFSVLFYILYLPEEGTYTDCAPNDESMKLYKSDGKPPETKLIVEQTSIDFGQLRRKQTEYQLLEISNQGETPFRVNIDASDNIRIMEDSVLLKEYDTQNIKVIVDAEKLEVGTFTESIRLTSTYGNETVDVYFEVLPEPILGVDTEEIDFGECYHGQSKAIKIHIFNKVKGPINVGIHTDGDWFRVDTKEFDIHEKYVKIQLNTKRIPSGPLEGSIIISSSGGRITVPLKAELKDSFFLDQEEIEYGELDIDVFENNTVSYTITNNTNKKLDIAISTQDEWINCSGVELELDKEESKEMKISLNIKKMPELDKRYKGIITIESKYDKVELPVSAKLVQTPPKLCWLCEEEDAESYTAKVITGKDFEHSFIITNEGSGELEVSYEIDKTEANFRLFTRPCTLCAGEKEEILVKLKTKNLEIGTYHSTLNITSNGGDIAIPITIEVVKKPVVIIKLTIGSSMASINGEVVMLEEAPYIKCGTTMVPLRFIGEAFKAEIQWENIGKGRIKIILKDKTIQLDIGKKVAFINDEAHILSVAPEIKSGRTFVPIRFIGENLGATIEWDAKTQTITITYELEIDTENE